MLNLPPFMGRALALSLLLHAGALALLGLLQPSALRVPLHALTALDVRMRDTPRAPAPLPAAPELILPRESSPHASAAPPVPAARHVLAAPAARGAVGEARQDGPRGLAGAAARSAHQQLQRALLYPREAIEQGIEGEAMVLLFLDESGNVIAARLEASSGHAQLDEAAVRAARTLRALPEGAPREALLPVRFRLR